MDKKGKSGIALEKAGNLIKIITEGPFDTLVDLLTRLRTAAHVNTGATSSFSNKGVSWTTGYKRFPPGEDFEKSLANCKLIQEFDAAWSAANNPHLNASQVDYLLVKLGKVSPERKAKEDKSDVEKKADEIKTEMTAAIESKNFELFKQKLSKHTGFYLPWQDTEGTKRFGGPTKKS